MREDARVELPETAAVAIFRPSGVVVVGVLQMSGATVSFVIFWSAVGGSTLLLLAGRQLWRSVQSRDPVGP